MPRVFLSREIAPEAQDMLGRYAEVRVWPETRVIPRDALISEVAEVDGLLSQVTDRIDDELLEAGKNLKIVANMAVGYDNFDVPALTRHGVIGANTPGVLTETTADFAFALIMAVARNLVQGERYARAGLWKAWDPTLCLGADVHHSVLGIVGLGRIGIEVARRARAFNMRILYYGTTRKEPGLERELGVEYRDLGDLLGEADFVSINVNLNESTRKLFNADRFRQMKESAYLINAARGPIVDTQALYEALTTGEIAGAALDVTDPEPLPPDHPLLKLDNCIVCPHIGSASVRTRTAMAMLAAENIVNVLQGKPPLTPVNPEVVV